MNLSTALRASNSSQGFLPGRLPLRALASLLAVVTLEVSAEAHAPPYATGMQWLESPHGSHAVVRTNRGLIFQDPRTETFSLLCGEAFQSSVTELAPFAASPDGALFAASYEGGLQQSTADRCSFEPVTEIADVFVADLQLSPDDAEDVFALALPLGGSAATLIERRGALAPWVSLAAFEGAPDSLRVASADSDRVYVVSMRSEGERQIADVLHSFDRGETFSRSSLSLPERELRAYVLDAGQRDPDRVLLRTQTADGVAPERLLLSEDGGVNFNEVLNARGPLTVATRADDDTVWAGGFEGLFRSQDRGSSFTRVEGGPERIECLLFHAGLLYACGYAEGEFGVLVSSDAGETFDWFLRFPQVRTRLRCHAESDEGRACEYPFEDWAAEQLGSPGPSGGGSSPEPATAAEEPRRGRPSGSPESPGCSSSTASPRTAHWATWLAFAIALSARCRSRRRSAPGTEPRRH